VFFLAAFILLVCNSRSSAQSFDAGLIAGLSTTQISGDQLSGFNKVGVIAGGFVSTFISEKFDGNMQLMYIQKGSRKNADPEKNDYTSYLLRLSYIEVPLLLQWKYSNRFIFEAGPSFGVLLSSYEENEIGELPDRRAFNDFEFGGSVGMNIVLVNNLIFNARLSTSIIPVRDHQSGQTFRLNAGQYNSVLAFTVQYKFGKNTGN
jgi:hypothetical protein